MRVSDALNANMNASPAFAAAAWLAIISVSLPGVLFLTAPLPADVVSVAGVQAAASADDEPAVRHLPMPSEVRGLYLTSSTAGSKELRTNIIAYAKRNDLNAAVIDLKNSDGSLAFVPRRESLRPYAADKIVIKDLDGILEEMRQSGLYRIARIFVFQDPVYARANPDQAVLRPDGKLWADRKGVVWVDPASKKAWRYNAEIAREAYERGFDEVQFDYIRFPSDGNMSTVRYSKYDGAAPMRTVIGEFFRYMHRELETKGIPVSYDLFGFVTWHTHDLSIGQMLVDALPYGTAISAMVYPSHYPPGTLGFANPAAHPYEIVADSLRKANELYDQRDQECAENVPSPILPCGARLAHHRPWLQAFDLGAEYTPEMIRAQIRAARENGAKGWLLWNARNVYKDFNVR